MFKILGKVCIAVTVCSGLTACFKDEPLNAECDIEKAWVHYDNPEECTWNLSDTIIEKVYTAETELTFKVKPGTDRSSLAPQFVVTDGSTLSPASGSVRDFSNGSLEYIVTSQDGNWRRVYKVAVIEERRTVRDIIEFDFENCFLEKDKYYKWFEFREDGTQNNDCWATGNGGFAFTAGKAPASAYPSVSVKDGYDGACAKLETKSTGIFGAAAGMRIAAGNLFLGSFDASKAMKGQNEALLSTKFGVSFDKKPIKFIGYYKYKPGPNFQYKDGTVDPNRQDEGSIYAILYKRHYDEDGNEIMLNGGNVQTDEHIVAKAILPEVRPTDEWTRFEVDFDYYGADIDLDLLNSFGYNLAVVFSSSKDGAYFNGAIGSTLYIDKVSVICEKSK